MKISDHEQYSDEWWSSRRGLPTASKFGALITPGGKPSSQAGKYMCELIADMYAPDENAFEPSEWMLRGMELEEEARDWLMFERQHDVEEVGLIIHDDERYGASPDGMISDAGMGWHNVPLEIKCPKASTHVSYLLNGKLPDTYAPQVHGQMLVTDSDVALFMSYHPAFDSFFIEVKRDAYTAKLEAAVNKFCDDLDAARKRLRL